MEFRKTVLYIGDTVLQWLALSPPSKKGVGSIPRPGALPCVVCGLPVSLCLCGFCEGTLSVSLKNMYERQAGNSNLAVGGSATGNLSFLGPVINW